MLTSCMMVRRLKKDVLSQLPPKRRTQVHPLWTLLSARPIKFRSSVVGVYMRES